MNKFKFIAREKLKLHTAKHLPPIKRLVCDNKEFQHWCDKNNVPTTQRMRLWRTWEAATEAAERRFLKCGRNKILNMV